MIDKLNSYEIRFHEEYKEAIMLVSNIFKEALIDLAKLKDRIAQSDDKERCHKDVVMDEFRDRLSPNILKLIIEDSKEGCLSVLDYECRCVRHARIGVNVYGNPKYGEIGHDYNDIVRDMQESAVVGENETGYDIDRNLAVFIYDGNKTLLSGEEYDTNNVVILDVSATFIRMLSIKDKFGVAYENLVEDIRRCILSKIIAYGYNMRTCIHLYYNKFQYDKDFFNDGDVVALLELTLAKWAYSVANNLTSFKEYGVDLNTLMDYAKAEAQVDLGSKKVMNLVNLGMSRLRSRDYLMRRSIDKYIDHFKEECSNRARTVHSNPYAMNMPMKTYRQIKYRRHEHAGVNEGMLISAFESFFPKKPAAFTMAGIEAYVKPTDPKFAEFRRKERQSILAKLTSIERRRYTDLENDYIMLKAEVANAHSQDTQHVLLKRCAMLRDVIELELDRTNNEYLATILLALSSDIFAMQNSLSDRNIFKERNTRLYGQLKTTNKWDY